MCACFSSSEPYNATWLCRLDVIQMGYCICVQDCIRSLWDAAAALPSVQQLSLDLQTYEEVSVGYSLSDRTALTQLHLGLSDRGLAGRAASLQSNTGLHGGRGAVSELLVCHWSTGHVNTTVPTQLAQICSARLGWADAACQMAFACLVLRNMSACFCCCAQMWNCLLSYKS